MSVARSTSPQFANTPCRICLGDDAPLISPCTCRGTSRFVHLDCLLSCAEFARTVEAFTVCPTCKLRFFGEAGRTLNEACVQHYELQLGARHTATLMTKGSLAMLLQEQGEFAEARRLYELGVEGLTQQLGTDHCDTLRLTYLI